MVPQLINKIYFRVKSKNKSSKVKTEPVEFDRAELLENYSEAPLVGNITHIYNGYGYFEFVPKDSRQIYSLKVYRKFSETDEISEIFDLMGVSEYLTMTISMEQNGVFGHEDKAIRFRFDTNMYFEAPKEDIIVEIRNNVRIVYQGILKIEKDGA